jgi:hypothetical protein
MYCQEQQTLRRTCRWAAGLPTEQNQRASFPPSTAMDATRSELTRQLLREHLDGPFE